ncbi:hypothetical protein HOY80DRAFT_891715, partial [Tuber brumale]
RYLFGDPLYPKSSGMKAPPSRAESNFTNSAKYRYLSGRPTVKPDERLFGY